MNIFSHNRLTGWFIGVLILLNLLTLGTLWYREIMRPPFPPQFGIDEQRRKPDEWLKHELGMDQEQARQFDDKREKFLNRLNPEKRQIHQLNVQILQEAFSPAPDQEKIVKWSAEIGTIESNLSLLLFDHLQDLKQIARPDQQEKLQGFFQELFRHTEPIGLPGPSGKPGADIRNRRE
jgi:hypothetical protein